MIAKQSFGRTGHMSTRAIFGAAALAQVSQETADRTLELLIQYGINHIDTAASYGDAELRLGPWMPEHRGRFFLATKTEERTYRKAKEELHRSLKRMQVDYVDMWQMHLLVEPEEWEVAMAPGGALEAFIEARNEGLTRFLGVTGHGLNVANMHLRSLRRFDFDAVLLPCNFTMMQNPVYAESFETLYQVCQERDVGFQTIKSIARRRWGEKKRDRATWYEPLTDQGEIDSAVHWVLGREGIFLITAADVDLLPMVLKAADNVSDRPENSTMNAIMERTKMEALFA